MKYKLISFDMDGVLFQKGNFWMMLHKEMGTLDEGVKLTEKYKKKDYDKLAREVVGRLWEGKKADKYFELIKNSEYNPGVKETIEELRKRGLKMCIISSGPSHLVQRAKDELGIDDVYANELVIENNTITGEFKSHVKDDQKLPLLKKICEKHSIQLSEVIAVGDDDNDIEKFKAVGFSIAFNTTCKELREAADVVVEGNDLKGIIPHIK